MDRLLAEEPAVMAQGVHRVAEPGTAPVFDPTLEALCTACPADADYLCQERAGILEFEAGFTRAEAERRAGLG